jgi:hypothetical protein
MKTKELKGVATAEQIAAWKKEHGSIFTVKAEESICYLKKPDRKTMSFVASLGNSPIRANEALLEGCWLGGDERFKTDDEYFFAISGQLSGIIEIKSAELEKL